MRWPSAEPLPTIRFKGLSLQMVKKKPFTRPPGRPEFRESDFAGLTPNDQAQLSGSLNQLSEQLAATRQMLQQIEREGPPEVDPPAPKRDDAA